MCKHCERIVEDVQHKETVHKFMQASADGVNRALRERAQRTGTALVREVTADDLEVEVKVVAEFWHPSAFSAEIQGRVIQILDDMWK